MERDRLHCFAESGNAYKVALMLSLTGADWEPVLVDFFAGAGRAPAFRALNEMGEVPVLETGGEVLTQSAIILETLARRAGRFLPADEAGRREVWRWILWDNHKLTANLATWRFQTRFVPETQRKPDVVEFLAGRARTALGVLDGRLAGRDWIVGDGPTIADLSCCGYLFYPGEIAYDPDAYPAVRAWTARIAALPGWREPYALMPRADARGAPVG